MNARQVILRPVISEKSYALLAANKYTFRVPGREQDAGAPGGRGDLRRARDRRAHGLGQAQAEAPRRHEGQRRRWKKAIVTLHPEIRSSSSKARRLADGHQEVQADLAGPPLRDLPPHEAVTKGEPEKSLTEGLRKSGGRNTTAASPRATAAVGQAPLPQDRLQAPQGRRAGQGRRDRVRPEPLGAHRAAPLRRRREALHPRAGAAGGRRRVLERPGADIAPGNALPLERIPTGTTVHTSS